MYPAFGASLESQKAWAVERERKTTEKEMKHTLWRAKVAMSQDLKKKIAQKSQGKEPTQPLPKNLDSKNLRNHIRPSQDCHAMPMTDSADFKQESAWFWIPA